MSTITNAVLAGLICQADKHIVNNVITEFVCDERGQWRYGLDGRPIMRQVSVATMRNGRDSYQTTLRMTRAYRLGMRLSWTASYTYDYGLGGRW